MGRWETILGMIGGLSLELSPGLNFVSAKFRVCSILPFYRVTIHATSPAKSKMAARGPSMADGVWKGVDLVMQTQFRICLN